MANAAEINYEEKMTTLDNTLEYIHKMDERIVTGDQDKLHKEVMKSWSGEYALLAPTDPENAFNKAIELIEERYYHNKKFVIN